MIVGRTERANENLSRSPPKTNSEPAVVKLVIFVNHLLRKSKIAFPGEVLRTKNANKNWTIRP